MRILILALFLVSCSVNNTSVETTNKKEKIQKTEVNENSFIKESITKTLELADDYKKNPNANVKDGVNLMMTSLMLGSYNMNNVANKCSQNIEILCPNLKEKSDKVNCIIKEENRIQITNSRCNSAIMQAVGPIPIKEDIEYKGIIIPAGSKVTRSNIDDNVITRVKFKNDFVYKGITYSKNREIYFRENGYLVLDGRIKSNFKYMGNEFKPNMYTSFNENGVLDRAITVNDYKFANYTIPAGSFIDFDKVGRVEAFMAMNKNTVFHGINLKKGITVTFKRGLLEFEEKEAAFEGNTVDFKQVDKISIKSRYAVNELVINNNLKENKTVTPKRLEIYMPLLEVTEFNGIKYTDKLYLDEDFNVLQGVLAEPIIKDGVEYKKFSIISYKEDGSMYKKGEFRPKIYIEPGTKIVSQEYHFVLDGKSMFEEDFEEAEEKIYKLVSLKNKIHSGFHFDIGRNFVRLSPKNKEFTVVDTIPTVESKADLILVDKDGIKYRKKMYGDDEISEILAPYEEYNNIDNRLVNLLEECENRFFKCKFRLKPILKDENGKMIYSFQDKQRVQYPYSPLEVSKTQEELIKFLNERGIEYTSPNDKDIVLDVKLSYEELGAIIFDGSRYGIDVKDKYQENSMVLLN